MDFSNQVRSKKFKRIFNVSGIVIVLAALGFLWLKMDVALLITIAVFIVFIGIFQFMGLQDVFFSTENNKIIIRYYPIVSIFRKEYASIEFAQNALVDFHLKNEMGFVDLILTTKTRHGIAEYPPISLAALSKAEIEQIRTELAEILNRNKEVVYR